MITLYTFIIYNIYLLTYIYLIYYFKNDYTEWVDTYI